MFEGKLFVLSAPSGSGKTTLVKHLLQQKDLNLAFSISATSRKPRINEQHGKDYYFLNIKDFKKKIKKNFFLEWEEVYKNCFYGTLRSEVERIWKEGRHVVFDIDVVGGLKIKSLYPKKTLAIFVQAPCLETLRQRLKQRGTDQSQTIEQRNAKAHSEMQFAPKFDTILINDDLKTAKKNVVTLVKNFLK